MMRPALPSAPLLAVIIPAYKGRHLARTLESFARQTDRRFRVYVGDDASPEELGGIVAAFHDRLEVVYRRFEENFGRQSLARHWDRAIALSDEPWLWVFSDDDIAAPDCVAAFLTRLAEAGETQALFRFQVTPIDADDRELDGATAYRDRESWGDYTQRLLRADTWIVLQNVIFRRSVYQAEGGFCDFPLGFGTDLVSWAKFARVGGLETLARGRVYYRRHAAAITTDVYHGRGDKVPMLLAMQRMLLELRRLGAERGAEGAIPAGLQLDYFCRQFRYVTQPLTRGEVRFALKILRELWPAWVGVRELWFGWHWLGPRLRRIEWYARLAIWRQAREKS